MRESAHRAQSNFISGGLEMKNLLLLILICFPLFSFAQEDSDTFDLWVEQAAPPAPPTPPEPPDAPAPPVPPDTFMFISEHASHTEELVKDAPYSAEAVTERTQYLGDGNRIYRKGSTKLFRDSQGRTRREHIMDQLGQWSPAGKARTTIAIHDPVSQEHYILDPEAQTARKISFGEGPGRFRHRMMHPSPQPPGPPASPSPDRPDVSARPPVPPEPPIAPYAPHPPHPPRRMMIHAEPGAGMMELELPDFAGEAKKESLGKKVIEGVAAEGTRTVSTIDAGKIGNERPIEIVSEKWYSPELKVTIMTKHTDPRFGETIYRLTKIKRTEPDASLFKIPSGFKIVNN